MTTRFFKMYKWKWYLPAFVILFTFWTGLNLWNLLPLVVPSQHDSHKIHYILLWNDWYGDKTFWLRQNLGLDWNQSYGFAKIGCPEQRCVITSNRSLFNSTGSFSSIVFHQSSFTWKDVPMNTSRKASQLFVHFTVEAPPWDDVINLKSLGSYFNITMSYRQDADIFLPYGKVFQSTSFPNSTDINQLIQQFGQRNTHLARKENHSEAQIAWFASNCNSKSGREALVASLAKHLPVDIYGNCGKLNCRDGNTTNCLQLLERQYKFYLSLENSICKDYVTEKFFKILPYNTIPVVMNGADMANIAPKHSFINIFDFASTAELATYLKKVAKDDKLFASYFWWKDFYIVKTMPALHGSMWCQLCSKLHNQDVHPTNYFITDLWQYWNNLGSCRNPPFIEL